MAGWGGSHKAIREFGRKHPGAAASLAVWRKEVRNARWAGPMDVLKTFRTADVVADKIVFDIARNRYRLIAWIKYRSGLLFIKGILTHKECDEGKWK